MLQFEELRLKLEALEPSIKDLAGSIGLDGLRRQAEELERILRNLFEQKNIEIPLIML